MGYKVIEGSNLQRFESFSENPKISFEAGDTNGPLQVMRSYSTP